MTDDLPAHALEKLLADAEPLIDRSCGGAGAIRLGKYKLVREIGRGGMAVVFEAEDLELHRRVALKLLALPPGARDEVRERFVREARAAAKLNHPGIAAVYDAGDDAIAMQLVGGAPLSLAPRGDDRRLVRLIRDAALAVHYAHGQGVVHRDLKPQNLLVEGDRVVVTDFGLAKDAAADAQLSLSGHVLGTPAYMSPEQAEGRVRDADPRTDVYGLGATLYDLLAGRPPFVERDVVRLLRQVVDDEPAPIHAIRRDVPRDLERVVLKCLAKEKERRYASARELADDLTRWLDGDSVRAQPPSWTYRAAKFARRRRALVAFAGASAAALVIAGFALWSARAQTRASASALDLSHRVASVLADADTHRRLGDVESASQQLDEGIAACRAFVATYEIADAYALLGRCLRARGLGDEARVAFDRALEIDPDLAEARLERGLLLAAELSARAAESAPADLRALRETALADLSAAQARPGSLRIVDSTLARAELARLRSDRAEARKLLGEALRLDPLHLGAKISLSQLELEEGNGDAAWKLAMSAVDLYRGFGPVYLARGAGGSAASERDAVERAVMRHELTAAAVRIDAGDRSSEAFQLRGSARLRIDDVEGALADFAEAVRVDPNDAMAHANRGLVRSRKAASLAAAGKIEEALEEWETAVRDYRAAITIDPTLAGARNNAAVCLSEKERLLEAMGRGEDAAAERRRAGEELDAAIELAPRFGLAFLNRGMQRRRVAEAAARALDRAGVDAALRGSRSDLDRALELKPGDPAARVERALVHELAARSLEAAGQDARAAEPLDAASADLDAAVAAAPDDARARGHRGLLRMRRGDRAGAADDLAKALLLAPDASWRARLEQALRTIEVSAAPVR